MIAIIDYDMGNLRNVQKALQNIGAESIITKDPVEIYEADKIILPGVGAFKDAIYTINHSGLRTVLDESVAFGKPFLGICLGMQLLFDRSYENGTYEGLGYIPGEIVKLDVLLKVPHVGWNTLEITKEMPLFSGIKQESYVHFVHSYHMKGSEQYISAYTQYGERFGVAVQKDNLYGMQFHPEKSGEVGLKILKNFVRL
ncbi:MAG: imidazole glycerol phosphate synthase subunit HisH [Candidatus Niameybacter stercoravium]|nr:imidazole glycerol phosphate synthase subunit HisH [Candidatus Niameybacter stercoravium]